MVTITLKVTVTATVKSIKTVKSTETVSHMAHDNGNGKCTGNSSGYDNSIVNGNSNCRWFELIFLYRKTYI